MESGRVLRYPDFMNDSDLVLTELRRLEAERKLRTLPRALLESSWANEAQIEAVVDAVLTCATAADARALAHARHVGEWAARIACHLPEAPSLPFMRRFGVLADVEPAVLESLPEVRDLAPAVREFQYVRMGEVAEPHVATLIVAVADEFDSLIENANRDARMSARDALHYMQRSAKPNTMPIVQALRHACRSVVTGSGLTGSVA